MFLGLFFLANVFVLSSLAASHTLYAGGVGDEVNGTVTRPKVQIQTDEVLLNTGNSPVKSTGHRITLEDTEAMLIPLANTLNVGEVLVWSQKQPIEGDLRTVFLRTLVDETKPVGYGRMKKWGYGILTVDQAKPFVSEGVATIVERMQALGLDVCLHGNLIQAGGSGRPITNEKNELFVIGKKTTITPVSVPVPLPAAEGAPLQSEGPSSSASSVIAAPKMKMIPMSYAGNSFGTLSVEERSGKTYPTSLEIKVQPIGDALDFMQSVQVAPHDPAFARKMETEVKEFDSYDQPGVKTKMPIVRRSWQTYLSSLAPNQESVVVFFSGRSGRHQGIGKTDQSLRYFLVDSCSQFGDVLPDYVFCVPKRGFDGKVQEGKSKGWSFWQDNSVTRVVLDDRRFMDRDNFPDILRILKPGGVLEFSPSIGMLNFSDSQERIELSSDGTIPFIDKSNFYFEFNSEPNTALKQAFRSVSVDTAKKFYGQIGFSDVRWNEDHRTFELVK